jgi:hypothetical protein
MAAGTDHRDLASLLLSEHHAVVRRHALRYAVLAGNSRAGSSTMMSRWFGVFLQLTAWLLG